MRGFDYIFAKQTAWAKANKIELVGSKLEKGRPAYTKCISDNIFEGLMDEVEKEISAGDGGELVGPIPKISAVHSSSALGVNIFQYWRRIGRIPIIAAACGLCTNGSVASDKIVFEDIYKITTVRLKIL